MNRSLQQIALVMEQEFYKVKTNIHDYVINNCVLWPVLFGVSAGYFMPIAYFGKSNNSMATEMVAGAGLLQILVIAFFMTLHLLEDQLTTRVFQYQTTVTNFATTLAGRYVFATIFIWFNVLSFYPVVKLVMGARLYTDRLSWMLLSIVLLLASALSVAYVFCWSVVIKSMKNVVTIWEIGIETVLWLGGMWVPGYAMARSGKLGWLVYFNPFLYVTEAIRQLFFNDTRFVPLAYSCLAIVSATICLWYVAFYVLKKKNDCVA